MMNALYSFAILPSASVSSPGMSIAHSRANVTWSRSSTSSLNACRAPSGNAMSRTGMSRLESHDAAFTRCERCSRLILMSPRLRMPRTVGIRPTAVYGLIIRSLLECSPRGDARDLAHAIVLQLDRDFVLLRAVGRPIDDGAPAGRRDALVLLVGPAEAGHHLVVARAGRDLADQVIARRHAAVHRAHRGCEPPPNSATPADAAVDLQAEHEHAREVRHEQDQRRDHDRAPVDAAGEVVVLHAEALGGHVLRRQQRERHDLAAGAHAALAAYRRGRRDLLDLEMVGVAEVGDDQ